MNDPVLQAYFNIFSDNGVGSDNLSCSGDLVGCLRRTQLRRAGAPTPELSDKEQAKANMAAVLGRMWHDAMEREMGKLPIFEGRARYLELRLSDYLPPGWGGRLDAFVPVEEADDQAWRIVDYKFKDSNALHRAEMTEAYEYQLTAYYHALVSQFGVDAVSDTLYIYMLNRGPYVHVGQAPYAIHKFKPIAGKDELWAYMIDRKARVDAYVDSVKEGEYLTDLLAGPQEPDQKLVEVSADWYDVTIRPTWEARYCEYGDLCPCGGTCKPGRLGSWTYDDGAWSFNYEWEGEPTVPRVAPPGVGAEELAEIQDDLNLYFRHGTA